MRTVRAFTPIDGVTASVANTAGVPYNIENAISVNFRFTTS